MADNLPKDTNTSSDEIDLGQLLQIFKRVFNKMFTYFLKLFVYLKRNFVILIILGIIGMAVGYGLSFMSENLKKTEIIVKPNFESKDYLYGIVKELQSKVIGNDEVFFKELGIELELLHSFKIEIEPVQDEKTKNNLERDLKYLEYLGSLREDNSIKQVVKNEVLASSYVNHKISFYYKESGLGDKAAKKIMSYINENGYFKELKDIYLQNSQSRIKENEALIKQIDNLIENYTKALGNKSKNSIEGNVLVGNEEGLNIPELLNLKNNMIQSTAANKLILKEQKETIKVINFGGSQEVSKKFFNKGLIFVPTILIGMFFLWSIIKYLDKKAKEIL